MSDANPSNLILFFGHFHPVLVHLPIGFLTLLAVLELANRIHHFKHAAQARGVVLGMTVAAAVVTVVCGLMLATEGGYDAHLLAWHKWMGIGLACCCIATAICFWSKWHRLYVGLLMITLLLLGPASHFGGSITHGEGYLTEYAPNWIREMVNGAPAEQTAEKTETSGTTPTTQKGAVDPAHEPIYAAVVRPVLAQNCLSCHNAEKLKGQLRLDSIAAMKQGGKSGPAVVAGDAQGSPLVQRIELPETDQKHMPPAGKSPLSDDDIALLKWWVAAGTPVDQSLSDLDVPVKVGDILAAKLGLPPAPSVDPIPAAEVKGKIEELAGKLGIVIEQNAVDGPWVSVNASINRTLGDSELQQLGEIGRNITGLNLAYTRVTDSGLAVVAKMPNLERIRLEHTAVTDAGLHSLSKLRKLDYVNLYATAISEKGLEQLRGLPSLRHLYLWRTQVPTTAAARFADSMTDHAKIARLRDEIAALQNQISGQAIEVVGGTIATSAPAATGPATGPATTAPATKPVKKAATRRATTRPAKS